MAMKKKNNNMRKSKKPVRQDTALMVIGKIPPYQLQPIRKMCVRVTTGNADFSLDSLTAAQLAKLVGYHCVVTNVSAYYLASQFRLDKIEMWATPPATADTVTVGLKWADSPLTASVGIANPPVSVEDSSGTPNVYAHVALTPRRNTLADNWFGSAATLAMLLVTLQSTAGNATATLDFHFSWVLDDIGSTPTFAVTASTAGNIYHGILTGSAGAVYTPVPPLNAGS
jgi:hypothetical protein